MYESPSVLILLTYKGKALLMHKQKSVADPEDHPWSFISGMKQKSESFEKTLEKRVYKEMGIIIEKIKLVSKYNYHARLTDNNVNEIKRSENQLLDFFSPDEIKKLSLSNSTKEFILKNGLELTKQSD